jgi:hypothetical protein
MRAAPEVRDSTRKGRNTDRLALIGLFLDLKTRLAAHVQ